MVYFSSEMMESFSSSCFSSYTIFIDKECSVSLFFPPDEACY